MGPDNIGASNLGGFSIGATIAGGFMEAFGTSQSAAAQARMLSYRAGLADLNRKIALQNRDWALVVGEQKAVQYGLQARQRMGAIRVAQGASGIDIGSGTSVDVRKGQRLVTGMDLATIRENAAREAYGYEVKAAEAGAEGTMYRMGAEDVTAAGDIGVAKSILGTATSVADKWLYGNQLGMWGGGMSPEEPVGALK